MKSSAAAYAAVNVSMSVSGRSRGAGQLARQSSTVGYRKPGQAEENAGLKSVGRVAQLLLLHTVAGHISEGAEDTAFTLRRNHLCPTRGAKVPDLSQASRDVALPGAITDRAAQVRFREYGWHVEIVPNAVG